MNCNCTNVSIIIHPSCHNFFITSISILITKEFSPKGEKLVKKVHKPLQDVQYSGELVTVEEKWFTLIIMDYQFRLLLGKKTQRSRDTKVCVYISPTRKFLERTLTPSRVENFNRSPTVGNKCSPFDMVSL